MRLGSRSDLTVAQRETVQDIWANWSVRRAAAAMDNGNVRRAVDILDAASQAFPDNLTVRKAVAGGFARVGRAKESLALYKTIPMQDASSGDFQGAIGAALQANDRNQAELWLRQALERFPHDPAILSLAARYEQARGDNQRAADYWRAALAAMPPATPAGQAGARTGLSRAGHEISSRRDGCRFAPLARSRLRAICQDHQGAAVACLRARSIQRPRPGHDSATAILFTAADGRGAQKRFVPE